MHGYEKVNKRVADRAVRVAPLAGDHVVERGLVLGRATPAKKRRSKKAVRFVDFRAVASESPAESIAREREIVTRLASDL